MLPEIVRTIVKTEPGKYPLVVTAQQRRTSSTYQIDGAAVCVPLISSTGHGDAAIHRVHYQEGKFAVANLLVALLPKDPNICDTKYLYHLLMRKKDEYFVPLMRGTSNVSLKEKDIAEVEIPLPPLEKQQHTVTQIEELMVKVEEARGLRSKSLARINAIVNAETTQIFNSLDLCEQVPLGQLGENGLNPIQTGPFGSQLLTSEFVSSGIPVLNVGNVRPEGLHLERLDHVTPEKAESLSRYTLQTDDLLFARTGATLGKVCLVPEGCDDWLMTGHLFRVRLDQSRCDPRFAFVALRGAESIKEQIFGQVRGATRPGFNTTLLSKVQLPLPSLTEQCRIVSYLDDIQAKVDQLKQLQFETEAELNALLPSILDKAFKGEL